MLGKKGALRNFTKFTGKHLCQSLFFNKVAGQVFLLKKRLWHRCFPANFVKFLRTPFLQNTSGRLLLNIWNQYLCWISIHALCYYELISYVSLVLWKFSIKSILIIPLLKTAYRGYYLFMDRKKHFFLTWKLYFHYI